MSAYLCMVLGLRNDDAEGLMQIIIVIIIFSISIVSNIIRSRSKKAPHPQGGQSSGRQTRPAGQDAAGTRPTPGQELEKRSSPAQTATASGERPDPNKPREVALRPRSISPARKASSRQYASAGDGEAMAGKSRLDRFLEAKLEPVRQPTPIRSREQAEEQVEGLEDLKEFARLDDVSKREPDEQKTVMDSLDLNADNLADAIVFAEILGKPLALRGRPTI